MRKHWTIWVFFLLSVPLLQAAPGEPASIRNSGDSGTVPGERSVSWHGMLPGGGLAQFREPGAFAFEANRGQAPDEVRFLWRTSAGWFLASPDGFTLTPAGPLPVPASDQQGSIGKDPEVPMRPAFGLRINGRNLGSEVIGEREVPARSHYFIGNEPDRWIAGIPRFERLRYVSVYPGIDLTVYADAGRLEYDWVVSAGADPGQISFSFRGTSEPSVDNAGNLVLESPAGSLTHLRPSLYQLRDGKRESVEGSYRLVPDQSVGFRIGGYDPTRELVIDPVLVYSSFLGGSADEAPAAVAVDSQGYLYVAGNTSSLDFPAGDLSAPRAAGTDVFVSKFDPTGSTLIYTSFIGGNGADLAFDMALDESGQAVVATGVTYSTNYPVTAGALQQQFKGGSDDAFVTRLSLDGTRLLYSTYIGGTGSDRGLAVAIASTGEIAVAGQTSSFDFPLFNSVQSTFGQERDGFVLKMDPSGAYLVFSTYLGGFGSDRCTDVSFEGDSKVLVSGDSGEFGFPLTNSCRPYQAGYDSFVLRFDGQTGQILASTFLGGSSDDYASAVARGSVLVWVAGQTTSPDFSPLPYDFDFGGASDGFLVGLEPETLCPLRTIYLGGEGDDSIEAMAASGSGTLWLAGSSSSQDLWSTIDPLQEEIAGGSDAYVVHYRELDGSILFGSPLGGSGRDEAIAIAVGRLGQVHVLGTTQSPDFPTENPFQGVLGGGQNDLLLARIFDYRSSYLAHLGSGEGLKSEILLTNPSRSEELLGTTEFRNDSGAEEAYGIVGQGRLSSVPFTIPPLGLSTIRTDGTGSLSSGAAMIQASSFPGALVRFEIPGSGIAGVGSSVPAEYFVIPVRRRPDGLRTGVALHNPQNWWARYRLNLFNGQGRRIGTAGPFEIPGGGHVARFADELFPSQVTGSFEGTLQVEGLYSSKLAATALELGPIPGQFTALPVIPRKELSFTMTKAPPQLYRGIAVAPSDPPTWYAGTWGQGVLRSRDGGESWVPTGYGLSGGKIDSIVVHPSDPQTVFAAGLSGVFRSSNGGGSWVQLNGEFGVVDAFALDPKHPETLFVGSASGLHKSTNGGAAWRQIRSGSYLQEITAIAIAPNNSSVVYVGTNSPPYLFRSSDGGETWTAGGAGLPGIPYCLAVDPVNSSIVYAGGGWVSKSTDGGATFNLAVAGLTSVYYSAILIDPADSNTVFTGTGDGVFKTVNGGVLWEPVGLDDTPVYSLAWAGEDASELLAAAQWGVALFKEKQHRLRFPHFGNGGGLVSEFVLSNPSSIETASGRLDLWDDSGLPLSSGIIGTGDVSSIELSIPPRASVTISTDGLGQLAAGSAVFTSNVPCGGVVRFEIAGIGIAGIGGAETSGAVILPVRVLGGISTGVAVQNAGAERIDLTITLRTAEGEVVATTLIEGLASGGHLAQFVDELFSEIELGEFEGTLTVESDGGPVAAVALELGTKAGEFTALPVTALR